MKIIAKGNLHHSILLTKNKELSNKPSYSYTTTHNKVIRIEALRVWRKGKNVFWKQNSKTDRGGGLERRPHPSKVSYLVQRKLYPHHTFM
jgi:hypothetical protein